MASSNDAVTVALKSCCTSLPFLLNSNFFSNLIFFASRSVSTFCSAIICSLSVPNLSSNVEGKAVMLCSTRFSNPEAVAPVCSIDYDLHKAFRSYSLRLDSKQHYHQRKFFEFCSSQYCTYLPFTKLAGKNSENTHTHTPHTHTHTRARARAQHTKLTKYTSEPVASGACSSGGTAAGLRRSNDRTEVEGGTDEAETWRGKKDYVNTMAQTY